MEPNKGQQQRATDSELHKELEELLWKRVNLTDAERHNEEKRWYSQVQGWLECQIPQESVPKVLEETEPKKQAPKPWPIYDFLSPELKNSP